MVAIKNILVTGANTGIGYALTRQLAVDHNLNVFLAARTAEKGQEAAKRIQDQIFSTPSCTGSCHFIHMDVTNDDSVQNGMKATKELLQDSPLYGIVNNAGLMTDDADLVLNTNLYGTKRVTEAFLPLLDPNEGRIVNLGSGGGPNYTKTCSSKDQQILCQPGKVTWEQIENHANIAKAKPETYKYGMSKALVSSYTGLIARLHPNLTVSCVSPGWINTNMTRGRGATKGPEEGTVSIKHCLFEKLEGNGWYYGSDAVRSPYHYMRNPGEPAYTGEFELAGL